MREAGILVSHADILIYKHGSKFGLKSLPFFMMIMKAIFE